MLSLSKSDVRLIHHEDWREVAVSEGRRAAWLMECISARGQKDGNWRELEAELLRKAEEALFAFAQFHGTGEVEMKIAVGLLHDGFWMYQVYQGEEEDRLVRGGYCFD